MHTSNGKYDCTVDIIVNSRLFTQNVNCAHVQNQNIISWYGWAKVIACMKNTHLRYYLLIEGHENN